MMVPRILTHAYVFENGMVMAFDQNGDQMLDYQGRFEDVASLIKHDYPDINIEKRIWRTQEKQRDEDNRLSDDEIDDWHK